jgi:hypothetical protein
VLAAVVAAPANTSLVFASLVASNVSDLRVYVALVVRRIPETLEVPAMTTSVVVPPNPGALSKTQFVAVFQEVEEEPSQVKVAAEA